MSVLGELLHAGRNFGENTPQGFERYVSALMHCNRRSSLVGVTQRDVVAARQTRLKGVSLVRARSATMMSRPHCSCRQLLCADKT